MHSLALFGDLNSMHFLGLLLRGCAITMSRAPGGKMKINRCVMHVLICFAVHSVSRQLVDRLHLFVASI